MTTYTTPHSLPIIATDDFIASADAGKNLRENINALSTATNTALDAEAARADAADVAAVAAAEVATAVAIAAAPIMYSLVFGPQPVDGTWTTVRGTPIYVAGKFGNAVAGSGTAVLSAAGINPEPSTNLTIECWFKNAVIPPSGGADVIWGTSNSPWLAVEAVTGKAWFSAAGNGTTDVKSAASICDGAWHHIAVEIRRVAGKTELIGFWIDGAPVTGTFTPATATWNTTVTLRGLGVPGFDLQDTAAIDEFRIWTGTKYAGTFTPPVTPFVWDAKTVLLAHLDSAAMLTTADDYPLRPADAPGGSAAYTGTPQPTTQLTNDLWVKL